jgi:hypothetical protein
MTYFQDIQNRQIDWQATQLAKLRTLYVQNLDTSEPMEPLKVLTATSKSSDKSSFITKQLKVAVREKENAPPMTQKSHAPSHSNQYRSSQYQVY